MLNGVPFTRSGQLDCCVELRKQCHSQTFECAGDQGVLLNVGGCHEHLLGIIDVPQKCLSDRSRFAGKLASIMTAGQCSHTIPEGINVEVNADNSERRLIGLTYAQRWSRYLPVLPHGYCIRSDHEQDDQYEAYDQA
jgi:hypothetical protein